MVKKRFYVKGLIVILIISIVSTFVLAAFLNNNSLNTKTDAATLATTTLTVNRNKIVGKFSKDMLGVGFAYAFDPATVPKLIKAYKQINPGIMRYSGGLAANYVSWSRTSTVNTFDGVTADFYNPISIDKFAQFAKSIGSEVMIQVNIADKNAAMWADMVKYTNIEKKYNFKYWELGNELDLDSSRGVSPDEYALRVVEYQREMKKIDPSIIIISGVTAFPEGNPPNYFDDSKNELSGYLTKPIVELKKAGFVPDSQSSHWYAGTTAIVDLQRYKFPDVNDPKSWRNGYSRIQADLLPQRVEQESLGGKGTFGITEMNIDAVNYDSKANTNHFGAIWFGDILGRLAYSGTDYQTMFTGYTNRSGTYPSSYGMIQNNFISSSYYTYLMYSKYFGTQLLETSTSDTNKQITIWASIDPQDSTKLKLLITNLTGSTQNTAINLSGFNSKSAEVYELLPDRTFTSTTLDQPVYSKINGVTLNLDTIEEDVKLIKPKIENLNGITLSRDFPAYSVTSIILNSNTSTPTVSSTPTASSTPVVTVNPSASSTPISTSIPSPSTTTSSTPIPSNTVVPTLTRIPVNTSTPTAIKTSTPIPSTSSTRIPSSPTPISTRIPQNTPIPTSINSSPTVISTEIETPSPSTTDISLTPTTTATLTITDNTTPTETSTSTVTDSPISKTLPVSKDDKLLGSLIIATIIAIILVAGSGLIWLRVKKRRT